MPITRSPEAAPASLRSAAAAATPRNIAFGGAAVSSLAADRAPPCRVMLVDDSSIVRKAIERILSRAEGISVVASVANGQEAVEANLRCRPDVIILDIEMPVMDGLTALPLLLSARPRVKILIASQLTRRGAEIGVRCLAAGAADTILKPESTGVASLAEFESDVVAKVRALARPHRPPAGPAVVVPSSLPADRSGRPAATRVETKAGGDAPSLALRPMPAGPFSALAIGSSTGGPQALFKVLGGLTPGAHLPIFITQHMPTTFTAILAQHIARTTGLAVAEGVDGERVVAGRVYLAPGDFHMLVVKAGEQLTIRLTQTAPENFCRPSVDPMLRSLTEAYGRQLFCCILTGMGQDGLLGAQMLVREGGAVVAQDAATSVVWGMPGAVAQAGVCSAILPIDDLMRLVRDRASSGVGVRR